MRAVLQELPQQSAAAIVRPRSLGDCVLTTPAVAILKQARPDLRIAVVAEDRFASVFAGNPDIDRVLPPSIRAVRSWRPALTINLHGGTRSIVLTAASGARYRAGFAHFRAPAALNIRIPTAQEVLGLDRKVHTAEHLASAIFYLGAERQPIPRARLFAPRKPSPKPYAVIHPMAATAAKTWPADRFRALAEHLAPELEPIFIGGPGDDLSGFSGFTRVCGSPLEETKSLLAGASMFIGNDSGPAHMAAAFGVPVVVLFGPSDSVVWSPWQVESEVLQGADSRIDSISVASVVEAVERLRVAL